MVIQFYIPKTLKHLGKFVGAKRRRDDVLYIEDERGKRRKRHGSGYSDEYSDDGSPSESEF